jgi:hypothetical protein
MSKKLTPSILRDMILNEKKRLDETLETGNTETEKTKADETEASDFAKTIIKDVDIKDVDWMKTLSIKEGKLRKELKKIQEAKEKLRARIMKKVGE